MTAVGSDLWAPASVAVLKTRVAKEVVRLIEQHADAIVAPEQSTPTKTTEKPEKEDKPDGEEGDKDESSKEDTEPLSSENAASSSSSSEVKAQRLKHLLFDIFYLQRFIDPAAGDDTAVAVSKKMDLHDVDDAAVTRLKRSAADYAKKTYLLFALLA